MLLILRPTRPDQTRPTPALQRPGLHSLARPLGCFFFSCFSTLGHWTIRQHSTRILPRLAAPEKSTHLRLDLTGTREGSVNFTHGVWTVSLLVEAMEREGVWCYSHVS